MNGGTNNSANPSNYSVLYGFTLANPTRRGYSFDGWYLNGTKITGINTSAVSFSSVDALYTALNSRTTGNITIEARWTPLTYTISYNANGGSGSMSSHTTTYGSSIKIKDNTFTRDGYDFAGWTTKSDGTNDGHGWSTGSIPNVVGWSGT